MSNLFLSFFLLYFFLSLCGRDLVNKIFNLILITLNLFFFLPIRILLGCLIHSLSIYVQDE